MQSNELDWHDEVIKKIIAFDHKLCNLKIYPCFRNKKNNRLFVDLPHKGNITEVHISTPDIVILKNGTLQVVIEIEDDENANPKNILKDVITTAVAKYYVDENENIFNVNKILFAIIIKNPKEKSKAKQKIENVFNRLNQIISEIEFGSINKTFRPIFISNDLKELNLELNNLFGEIK